MPLDPALVAVSGALATVAGVLFKQLVDRIKTAELREARTADQFDRLADLLEQALGVKVPR